MERTTLSWDRGEATLQSLGGMLAPVRFDLEDGRSVFPLHVAPWHGEDVSDQPGVLQRLRGDWPCIPFGYPPTSPIPAPWDKGTRTIPMTEREHHPHGYGANHHWSLRRAEGSRLTAAIRYPEDSPIAMLEREVEGMPGRSEIACCLTVTPRRDCLLPIGLHPVFRLPEGDGEASLDVGPHRRIWSHPLDDSPPLSLVHTNRRFEDLASLRSRDDQPLSLTRLPLPGRSETLLLLTGACGRVVLTNTAERYRVILQWDRELFPSLMLWISNRGRAYRPWNGRHLALGIEPVRAAFDLGHAISASPNPLRREGTETAYAFRAGIPLSTRYSIRVEPA